MAVLLGGAGTTFSPGPSFAAGSLPYSLAVADFNADGNRDLAVANLISNNVSVHPGLGNGSFGAATSFATGGGPTSVAVGDFNADSDPDLAVANQSSDNVSVLPGGAGASFGAPTTLPAGDSPLSVAVGDFNADADPDLVVANLNSDNVSVLLGGAAASFGAATSFAAGDGAASVAVADFNADADSDLAVANRFGDDVSLLLNTSMPAAGLSSTSLVFGTQALGSLGAAQTLTVTNTGESALHIGAVRTAGAGASDFLVSLDSCTGAALPRGATCRLDVRFAPGSTGPLGASLQVISDAPTAQLALTGTGSAATAGPPGPSGAQGPPGTQGATGPQGPAGRDARVTCKVSKAKKQRVFCSVRLTPAGTPRATQALLIRRGALYASGRIAREAKHTRLRAQRRLGPGRYSLVLLSTDASGTTTVSRTTVRIR